MKPPFLWVGGKRDLLPVLSEILPKKFNNYYELFLGGGAIFFHLADKTKRHWVLNDINMHLINAYRIIKKQPIKLSSGLDFMRERHDEDFFYRCRKKFNSGKNGGKAYDASLFLYLISKCFRGLWRENKKGLFNSPIHRPNHIKRPIPSKDTLLRTARIFRNLHKVSLTSCDFDEAMKKAGRPKEGDLVILDPPYIPLNATSNFTSYNSDGFSFEDQVRLATKYQEMVHSGVQVVAFNNDVAPVYDLYKGATIHKVPLKRRIGAAKDKKHTLIHELIITNVQ